MIFHSVNMNKLNWLPISIYFMIKEFKLIRVNKNKMIQIKLKCIMMILIDLINLIWKEFTFFIIWSFVGKW